VCVCVCVEKQYTVCYKLTKSNRLCAVRYYYLYQRNDKTTKCVVVHIYRTLVFTLSVKLLLRFTVD